MRVPLSPIKRYSPVSVPALSSRDAGLAFSGPAWLLGKDTDSMMTSSCHLHHRKSTEEQGAVESLAPTSAFSQTICLLLKQLVWENKPDPSPIPEIMVYGTEV